MRVRVDDLASGQLVYVPDQTLANGLAVLASCDLVENGHIHASVSHPGSMPAETLDQNEWTEYRLRWDPLEDQ
jgi:hypothetical protein